MEKKEKKKNVEQMNVNIQKLTKETLMQSA